jgi:hypothetical protein
MAVNPYGYVPLTDGGTPRIITGYAKEVISGGQLVSTSGATGIVSSGADSFVTSDLQFYHTIGSGNFVGVALHDAASGGVVSVATRGTFILEVSGAAIPAGTLVGCNNADEVIVGSVAGGYGTWTIGRALTAGSEADYIVVDIHG